MPGKSVEGLEVECGSLSQPMWTHEDTPVRILSLLGFLFGSLFAGKSCFGRLRGRLTFRLDFSMRFCGFWGFKWRSQGLRKPPLHEKGRSVKMSVSYTREPDFEGF